MATVWNKFTTQLTNWIAEGPPGKWRRRESESADRRSGLRSSGSLSTINFNHKNLLRGAAVRSKSSENLNRIGGGNKKLLASGNNNKANKPEQCQCECCPPASSSSSSTAPSASKSKKTAAMNGPAGTHRFPAASFAGQNGQAKCGNESGYSSASPSRKKSAGMASSASSLFQNLRGRKAAKSRERAAPQGEAGICARDGPPQSNASSSGASSAATNAASASEHLASWGEAQKKKWWRLSGASLLPFADDEEVGPQPMAQMPSEGEQENGTARRSRRPSEPGLAEAHSSFHVAEPNRHQLQHYLISPPKRIGPKKTKSTFAILFPHSSHLPMSQSWNSNLARGTPQKGFKSPPDPAPSNAHEGEEGLTVPASEEFSQFQRRPSSEVPGNGGGDALLHRAPPRPPPPPSMPHSPSQETVREWHQQQQQRHDLKRKQSSGQRLVQALFNAGGRWRSNSRLKNPPQFNAQKMDVGGEGNGMGGTRQDWKKHQKRSRSVGANANQQMRISTTLCALPLDPASANKNSSGIAFDDGTSCSLLFGNLTFEDAHPAYWANVGFQSPPQSESYYSCTGGTVEKETKASPASSATSSRNGRLSLDIYRRLEKIGEGSYATVWKSENRIDGSIVALKEIRLQEQEGLPFTAIREISLLRALRHANIVRLHQIIIHQPKSLVLVFEYMRTDLAKYLEQFNPHGLDQFRVKVLLFQLLRGLAFCHERKILHRDLKPQNLLISTGGELKLADFGLARAKSVPSRTYSHDVVTLWYRPPDVLLGSTLYSSSLDLWGVGCIFGEMCSGTALFPGANEVADQLERIFAVRGLPRPEHWPECRQLPKWGQFSFAAYTELEWAQAEPALLQLGEEGEKLLNLFLQLNPRDRISAEGAMLHKYFDELPKTLHALLPTESVFSVLSCSFKWSSSPSSSSLPKSINRTASAAHCSFEYGTKV